MEHRSRERERKKKNRHATCMDSNFVVSLIASFMKLCMVPSPLSLPPPGPGITCHDNDGRYFTVELNQKYRPESFLIFCFSEIIFLTFRTPRMVISGEQVFRGYEVFRRKKNSLFPIFLAISPGSFLPGLMAAFPTREWENTGYMKRTWKRRLSTVSDMFLFIGARTEKRAKASVTSWRDIFRDGGDFRLIFA